MDRSVSVSTRLIVRARFTGLVLLLLGAGAVVRVLPAQDTGSPAGDADTEDVARYRERATDSERPLDHYNLGTALLRDGRTLEAQEPLQLGTRSERPKVRQNGFYNFGLSSAVEGHLGEGDARGRRAQLMAARQAFRQVLREHADDEDARWNLELVERWLEEDEESGGDDSAGGEAESPGGAGAGGAPSGGAGQDKMITPEEAATLLDSAGRAEAAIRDRVMGRNRFRDPVVEKNW